ncbi:Bug family tripartite tricarboxylate transporter substrate binding protein [Hahella ganghwensis]|uniref:Bug family tripartite tricarboxylate transporter substrate binding protein n=1 Tax=Hahella ganghwensis TaxID=286420 RepID=UPI00036DD535|nr:tripartite tricarboxylate transporter substrate-binding protein [Hahella ganghwensis]
MKSVMSLCNTGCWLLVLSMCFGMSAHAASVDTINFLIPGGEGGGWDTTARETGNALKATGLVSNVSFRNMSGGGGGRALENLIQKAGEHDQTLMVQSTPLILRNLTSVIKNGFRDITPVSLMIAEYQVVVVPADSPIATVGELISAVKSDYAKNSIIGGSAKGSLDHITAVLIMDASGLDVKKMRYVPSDGGGEALDRLYKKVGSALVTGVGEVIDEVNSGKLRVLGVTSEERIPGIEAKTMKEQGVDVVFANWRGFFAKPGLSDSQRNLYADTLQALTKTDEWKAIRAKYGWEDFYKRDGELMGFLETQEEAIRKTLQSVDML